MHNLYFSCFKQIFSHSSVQECFHTHIKESFCLTWNCDVKKSPSAGTGELGGSACILRLRVSTTKPVPPLRLLIMAYPFPPGSALQAPPFPPLPSPPISKCIIIPITGESWVKRWIPPLCYAQMMGEHTNRWPALT